MKSGGSFSLFLKNNRKQLLMPHPLELGLPTSMSTHSLNGNIIIRIMIELINKNSAHKDVTKFSIASKFE